MDIEARLSEIESRLARVEARLGVGQALLPVPPPTEVIPSPAAPPENNLLLAGRALIAVGVAYLLRALAEAKVFPIAVTVTLGFGYSAIWLWRSS